MKRLLFFLGTLFLGVLSSVFAQSVSVDYRWPDSLKGLQHNVKTLLVKDNIIFAGTGRAYLWVSADTGKTWVQRDWRHGLNIPFGTVFSLAATRTGKLLLGSWEGIYFSLDNGNTWVKISSFGSETASAFLVTQSGEIFAGNVGLWRSSDDGASWTLIADTSVARSVVTMTQTPSGVILAGNYSPFESKSRGVIRSTDNGRTWAFSNNGLSGWGKSIICMAAYFSGSSRQVFMTSDFAGIFRSDDEGLTWSHIDEIPEQLGKAVAVYPSLGIFVGATGSVNGDWQRSLYRSQQGSGWERIAPDLFNNYIVLSFAQFDSKRLLVGTNDGMFLLTFNTPTSVEPNRPAQLPTAYRLDQNYPNPFNPATVISYDLPVSGYVRLGVYNVLGQLVVSLVDGTKEAGSHTVRFDGSDLSSGVYLYRLEVGNFIRTRRMVLIR